MNQRLPSLKTKEVIRALEPSRTSGSHCRLIHSSNRARKVTVPLHSSTDLKRGTLRGIISQAGLTVAEFIALLR